MENKELEVYYKFHGKALVVDIVNNSNADITVSKVQLIKHKTDIVITEILVVNIPTLKTRTVEFDNVPYMLESKDLKSSDHIIVRCITSEQKQYENSHIWYSRDVTKIF